MSDATIQHKPTLRLIDDGLGFDDAGEIVQTTALNSAVEDVEDVLLAAGVRADEIETTLGQLLPLIQAAANRRAAEVMRRVLDRLTDTPAGVSLRWALLADESESLRDAAKRLGVSQPALSQCANRIRKRLAAAPPVITSSISERSTMAETKNEHETD